MGSCLGYPRHPLMLLPCSPDMIPAHGEEAMSLPSMIPTCVQHFNCALAGRPLYKA